MFDEENKIHRRKEVKISWVKIVLTAQNKSDSQRAQFPWEARH
jgi:hypothetical protein